MNENSRLIAAMLLLTVPVVAQFLSVGRLTRMLLLGGVFTVSLVLFLMSRREKKVSLSAFINAYFINLAVGNVRSAFGMFVFVILAAVLTQWLPDAIESGSIYWASWNIIYLMTVLQITYWTVTIGRTKRAELRKTKYLVFALSYPSWKAMTIAEAECGLLVTNSKKLAPRPGARPPNVLPLFVAVAYHLEKLEKVFLLVSKSEVSLTLEPDEREFIGNYLKSRGLTPTGNDFRDKLRVLLLKIGECAGRGVRVVWPDGVEEVLGEGKPLTFQLAVAGDFDDVDECRETVNALVDGIIRRESEELTFDLTGGTVPVSVAMALTSIRQYCQAQYLRQNLYDRKPGELLKPVNLDVFTVEDILAELREAFG